MTAPVYKQFCVFRTALYALAALVFLIVPAIAHAASNPAYTVEGVEVDVTAENAVKAREKALDEAQVKAYQMLAERFLSPDELKNFKAPDPITVSSLVQDYEVTNEQLSTTRYKGVFTVRFRPNAMKNQMASQGMVYSDTPRKPVLVLPFYEQGADTALWDETNPWMRAWRALPAGGGVMQPTVLPLGDAQDMAQVSGEEGLRYDPMRVQELASRYDADDVAILLASAVPTQTAQGRLVVNIYNNGFEGPVFVQKVTVDQMPGESDEAVYARAAQKVQDILRSNWKANAPYNPSVQQQPPAQTAVHGQPPVTRTAPVPYTRPALGASQTYAAHAKFASVQDWVRMKSTLDRVYGVQAVMIKTLKPREAQLDIRYAGP
ncbi:MAG TPA: DUF2066 domain-containing protein, partial [Micavibrio sp.]|nr:DUF2066 domain-containing protein [Micavibrio sp.]